MKYQELIRESVKILDSGCWIWQRDKDGRGYGRIMVGGIRHKAHRLSFESFKGPIAHGMHICHTCDIPSCVNPDHLFAGTAKDNVQDCKQKGRLNRAKGERNGRAKLSAPQVELIRQSKERNAALARQFGVSNVLIGLVKRGLCWRACP
jgi:hypothetical protein